MNRNDCASAPEVYLFIIPNIKWLVGVFDEFDFRVFTLNRRYPCRNNNRLIREFTRQQRLYGIIAYSDFNAVSIETPLHLVNCRPWLREKWRLNLNCCIHFSVVKFYDDFRALLERLTPYAEFACFTVLDEFSHGLEVIACNPPFFQEGV